MRQTRKLLRSSGYPSRIRCTVFVHYPPPGQHKFQAFKYGEQQVCLYYLRKNSTKRRSELWGRVVYIDQWRGKIVCVEKYVCKCCYNRMGGETKEEIFQQNAKKKSFERKKNRRLLGRRSVCAGHSPWYAPAKQHYHSSDTQSYYIQRDVAQFTVLYSCSLWIISWWPEHADLLPPQRLCVHVGSVFLFLYAPSGVYWQKIMMIMINPQRCQLVTLRARREEFGSLK